MVAPDHSRPPNADNTPEISTKRSQPRVDFRGEYSGLPLSSFHLPALSALAIFVIVVGRWPPCVESSFDPATELFSTVHWLAKPMARGTPKGWVYCSGIFERLLGVTKRRPSEPSEWKFNPIIKPWLSKHQGGNLILRDKAKMEQSIGL
ncbi:hypothetical protein K0M31_020251 [Melipona bicolor]|uniref:Uncharacterized protein n=1 Tax=Melipona bicolor TaxID=60889 RepID=A0AA40G1E8_9HYME|nr:hypothetical protein K0M31_020251 [Melipona bicolor]